MSDVEVTKGVSESARRTRRVALACALMALLVSGLAVISYLSAIRWHVESLVRMGPEDPITELALELDPDFKFIEYGHYDGVYYYAIGMDPLARGEAHTLIDLPAHRYGHPAYGWLAWVASLGRPEWVPAALLGVSLLGIVIAAYITSYLSAELGFTPWGGLLVALNPGLVFAVTADTSEAAAAAVMAGGIYLWIKRRLVPAGLLLAFLCFFKFQLILVPISLGLWEIVRWVRVERNLDRDLWKSLAILAAGPVVFALWMVYVLARFSELPTSLAPMLLAIPFVGFTNTILDLGFVHHMTIVGVQLASAQLPVLVCLMALFGIAVFRALRMRSMLDCLFVLQGILVLSLNWWNLQYPKDMIRSLAIPLILLVPVLWGASSPGGPLWSRRVVKETGD